MNVNKHDFSLTLRRAQAAKAIGVCEKTLDNWTEPRGPIPCIRIGKGKRQVVLYSVAALQAWLDREVKEQNGGQACLP
jgi:hypothetical protein